MDSGCASAAAARAWITELLPNTFLAANSTFSRLCEARSRYLKTATGEADASSSRSRDFSPVMSLSKIRYQTLSSQNGLFKTVRSTFSKYVHHHGTYLKTVL